MILTEKGVLKLMQRIKSFITSQLNTKASSVHTHSISEIDDLSSLSMGGGVYSKSEVNTLLNDYIPKSGGAVITGTSIGRDANTGNLDICGGTTFENGAFIALRGKDTDIPNQKGVAIIGAGDGSSSCDLNIFPDGRLTWGSKNVAMYEDVVPRSGGAVISSTELYRVDNTGSLHIGGGVRYDQGGAIVLRGNSVPVSYEQGMVLLLCNSTLQSKCMDLYPNGTWTWEGQAVQLVSDQRLKQQITEIDDKLLDAWEDVELSQFKYNDAVNEKGIKARLHTGYVVQQINESCQKHNVDISEYGLYCHEEYPERTEEVEVKQDDGSIKKETKVIEPAKEHYSLRYTETLVVECAYLRREVSKLKHQNENLEQRLKMLEQSVK